MVDSADVLLDSACSPKVRAAVQSVFPSSRLRAYDVEAMIAEDRGALSRACAIVFGMRTRQGTLSTPVIERLRAIAPHVGLFVVEERSDAVDPWLHRLAASGVDDAFALDRAGDEKVFHEMLANRVALPPPELALRSLWALWADCPVRTEAMYCVRNGYRPWHRFKPHVWWGLKDRAMRRQFENVILPTPLFLTRFGRILHWTECLTRVGGRPTAIASRMGFCTQDEVRRERRRVRKGTKPWPVLFALLN